MRRLTAFFMITGCLLLTACSNKILITNSEKKLHAGMTPLQVAAVTNDAAEEKVTIHYRNHEYLVEKAELVVAEGSSISSICYGAEHCHPSNSTYLATGSYAFIYRRHNGKFKLWRWGLYEAINKSADPVARSIMAQAQTQMFNRR